MTQILENQGLIGKPRIPYDRERVNEENRDRKLRNNILRRIQNEDEEEYDLGQNFHKILLGYTFQIIGQYLRLIWKKVQRFKYIYYFI